MIEQLASERADPSFGIAVLPGRAEEWDRMARPGSCGGEKPVRAHSRDPRVPMMEPANPRKRENFARGRRLDRPCNGRIAPKRHVRSVRVVIGHVLTDHSEQMSLTEHDDMIEQLASERADPSFGITVLPRPGSSAASAANRGEEWDRMARAARLTAVPHRGAARPPPRRGPRRPPSRP